MYTKFNRKKSVVMELKTPIAFRERVWRGTGHERFLESWKHSLIFLNISVISVEIHL